jgi:type II secretory pathway pseudopilin PulG
MSLTHWPRRLRARCAAIGTRDSGFTLIEAIVSFVIFVTVATSTSVVIYNMQRAARISQQRVDAAGVAQSIVADAIVRALTIAPVAGQPVPATFGDYCQGTGLKTAECEQFSAVENVTFDNGSCITGRLFTVNVVVSLKQTGQVLARSDARVACPRS